MSTENLSPQDPAIANQSKQPGQAQQASPVQQPGQAKHPVRIGLLIWGLFLTLLSAGILAANTVAIQFDLDWRVILVSLIVLGGIALVAGGVVGMVRQSRSSRPDDSGL